VSGCAAASTPTANANAAGPARAAAAWRARDEPDEPAEPAELDHLSTAVRPGVRAIQLIAPDMRCGACVATLERGLARLPGVVGARANLTAKRLTVEFQPARLRAAEVAAAATRLGYPVHPQEAPDAAEAAEAKALRGLLTRMGVAAFAAMNIMLLSVSVWSGAEAATRDLMHWLSAMIALPTVIYAGRPFYASALAGLHAGRLNMDAPISLAIILAAALSLYETARGGPETFFDAAVTLIFLLLVGRYLDRRMRARARSAATALARLQPRGARVLRRGAAAWTPLERVRPGDLVQVAPGERVAVDGVVVEGASELDLSHVTGEAAPEPAREGAAVRAGALNLSGALTLRATAVGEASSLGAIQRLMEAAESRKSRLARLADRAAAVYAPVVHLVALFTLIGWLALGADWREAAFTAIAVLIITCPCALGLAAPMAQAAASGALFRRGIMLKDGAALERLARVDRAVFDKTGTLTLGRPVLRPPEGIGREALEAAAALAAGSRHPLARALADWARAAGLRPAEARGLVERPGLGVEAMVRGRAARLGRAEWVGAEQTVDASASAAWLKLGDAAPLPFLFDDAPRPDAAETLAALAAEGLESEVLSGDREGPAAALAARVGAARWAARLTPEAKIARLETLAAEGRRALMVGDGVNDAPALAAAEVSMAPASGADVGRAAADIVFFGDCLAPVAEARRLAVRTRRVILQNFAIAGAYNAVAIPLAILGHAGPLEAAVAMSTSSALVVANALRLQSGGGPAQAASPGPPRPQAATA
jgi:Cu2+-exporting ATPase